MKAYIKAQSIYLPEKILSNSDLVSEFPEWSIEKITSKLGISKRHIAGEKESVIDMAVSAGEKLFLEKGINPSDIDFILLCTQSPDYFLPTSACIVQNRLKIPTSSGALDFNMGCSGYIYGLSLAKGLIFGNIAKNILLITSEAYSKHIHKKDKGNRSIFGDAATATLVSTNGFAEIQNFSLGTDGAGANNLIVKTGALKHPNKLNDLSFDESGNPISSDYLYMNGSEIFNFTIDTVPILLKETLIRNKIEIENIDLFIFHQANKFMLDYLRKKSQIKVEKFYMCIENYGNTVSSTIPIALKEAICDGTIKKSNNVFLAGFGVGYSWGGCILQF